MNLHCGVLPLRLPAALLQLAFVVALAGPVGVPEAAQSFPNQRVTLTVPYPAGGPSDFVARRLQPLASAKLGQPMVVENISGVSGAMGVQKVLNALPDGHTVLLATPMDLVLPPLNYAAVKYKPEDLKLVAHLGSTSMVLLVRKDLPYESVGELIQHTRRKREPALTYGSLGPGSYYDIVAQRFSQLAGITMLHVPYRGAAPLILDLMSGQLDLAFVPLAGNVAGIIKEGKAKALGVASTVFHPSHPSIPPMAVGALKEMDFSIWAAVAVPRAVPDEFAAKLHEAFYAAIESPEVRESLEASGMYVPRRKSLQELEQLYEVEVSRFRSLAKPIK